MGVQGGGHKDHVIFEFHLPGNMTCVCSPEHHAPANEGTSSQDQQIEGKDVFSFSVLGSCHKSTCRLSEVLGFAVILSKIKS